MELAARKILKKPLEIICGGRSVACKDVTQLVEVLPDEDSKFKRLLQLVHEWYERGQILIFVDRQSAADKLFQELVGANYSCLVLHGGIVSIFLQITTDSMQDQKDRASTLSDFKRGERNIMVATSVCARGIDVKGLELVINFDVPDHMEDYVHRVGRTGRAGRKGTAYTFVTPDKDRYAPDLVKALIAGEQQVPESLQEMADGASSHLFKRTNRTQSSLGKNSPEKQKGLIVGTVDMASSLTTLNKKDKTMKRDGKNW